MRVIDAMKNPIESLWTLQELELGPAPTAPEKAAEIARLRQLIPPQIMGHYDRLRARDKKGVSLVRNGVCTECHMRLASGIYAEVIRAEDIMICDSCGRYLLYAQDDSAGEAPAAAPTAPPPAEKPKTRKRKKKSPAAEAGAVS